jgi:hypothetical protein
MPKDTLSGYNALEADKKEKDMKKVGPGGGGTFPMDGGRATCP